MHETVRPQPLEVERTSYGLKSITAYRGRFILEYSHSLEGKPASRFVIENLPEGPPPASHSLDEAKRTIDELAGTPPHGAPFPKDSGARPKRRKKRRTAPERATPAAGSLRRTEVCPPQKVSTVTGVDAPILNALRDRLAEDGESVRRVARFLSVDSGVILRWLTGMQKPRQATLERIAAYLKGPAM